MVAAYPLRLRVTGPLINNPFATRPVKLTEANVIDDAYRAASGGIQGDGLLGNQSTGIWPAATNLNDNGNATTNTTGVTDHSSTTTRATSGVVKFGTTAFNVVSSNLAANEGPSQPINGGLGSTQYTVSAWVWLISGAATVRATLSDTVAGKQGGTAVALTATPQKVTVTATTGVAGLTEASYIETTVQQVGTWRIGGWQVETSPVATPYIATDGADATRAVGRIQLPISNLLTPTQGWVAMRIRPGWANTAAIVAFPSIFEWATDGNNRVLLYYASAANLFVVDRFLAASGGQATQAGGSFAAGTNLTFVGTWQKGTVRNSLQGSAFSSGVNTTIPVIAPTVLADVGRSSGTTNLFGGDFLWIALGSGVLPGNAGTIFNYFGNTKPTVGQIKELVGGSVGVWDGRTGLMQVSL